MTAVLSIVVPVLNEAAGIAGTLQALAPLRARGAEVIVAGGLETMSMIPMGGNGFRPNPSLAENYPDYYLNMGLTAENLAQKYEITREQADEFSLGSHQKAAAAIKAATLNAKLLPAIRWTPLAEANAQGRSPVLRRMAIPRTSVAVIIESIASSGME